MTGKTMSCSVLLILTCITMSISLAKSQLLPFPPLGGGDITQCWSSFQGIQGCLMEVFSSFATGRIGTLGPACCKAITEINDKCWPAMFPFNPFFPSLLKDYCAKQISGAPAPPTVPKTIFVSTAQVKSELISSEANEGKSLETIGGLPPVFTHCLSSLEKVQGCVQEAIASFSSGQVGLLGPACCNAIITINDECWPKILPFNPFFPPLVKDYCNNLIKISPTPSKIARRILPN